MLRFIRWSYVAPRLVVTGVVCLAVLIGTEPLLHSLLCRSLGPALGFHVEFEGLSLSPLRRDATLQGLQVIDPDRPTHNLLEADKLVLDVELAALLKKHIVVDRAHLRGLRFNTVREKPWHGSPENTGAASDGNLLMRLENSARQQAEAWLADIQRSHREDLRREFRSFALIEELTARWPAELHQLESRLERLQQTSHRLQRQCREAEENPLRDLAQLQRLTVELEETRRQLVGSLDELKGIEQQLATDTRAVLAAKAHDAERLRRIVELDEVSGEGLTQYLLGDEATRAVTAVIHWTNCLGQLVATSASHQPQRSRGTDVIFVGSRRYPDVLLRSLALSGDGNLQGEPFRLAGRAVALSSHPRRYARPTRVRLRAEGSLEMEMTATLDRRGPAPRDQLRVVCQRLPTGRRILGDPEQLALIVEPGWAELEATLSIRGDHLEGSFGLSHADPVLTAKAGEPLGGASAARRLRTALAEIDSLGATVRVSGKIDALQATLESPLGEELSRGIQVAFRRELQSRHDAFIARTQDEVDAQLQAINAQLKSKHSRLLASFTGEQQTLTRLAHEAAQRVKFPTGRIGERVRLRSPFLR